MTASIEIRKLHELVIEAAGRLLEIEPTLTRAISSISETMPGFRSNTLPSGHGTSGDTQPENYENINADSAVTDMAELRKQIHAAFNSAAVINRIVHRWGPITDQDKKKLKTLDPQEWCASCLRIAKCSPRFRGDQCRWCYEFKRATGQHPPIELIRDHHEGRRITEERIKDALRIRAS